MTAATEQTEPKKSAPARTGSGRPRVVIIGGGFAGINAAKALASAPVEVTLIDRRNHHLFQPLLYQVATASLNPSDIAVPIRSLLRKQRNARVRLGEVKSVDAAEKQVQLVDGKTIAYDYLIVAAGARHSYFGRDEWEEFAPGMKTLDDALDIRSKVLLAFEEAEKTDDLALRKALLTFVVIGGGPTGVELAGAIAEIGRYTVARDFRSIDPTASRVILLEALPRILPMFSEKLSQSATDQLGEIGVQVRTGGMVTLIEPGVVHLGEEKIESKTIIWAAGVAASPLGRSIEGVTVDRAGRVPITKNLNLEAHPEIFVLGDMASLLKDDGKPVPGVAPAASQMGTHAGENVARLIAGQPLTPFVYEDKGTLATIGRNHAIGQIGDRSLTGFTAWMAWNVVHVAKLTGVRNRISVSLRWISSYISHYRGARLIE